MKLTRGKKITLWIVGIILFIILGLGVGTYIYAKSLLNKMEKVEKYQEINAWKDVCVKEWTYDF